ncbi:MAG TPA: tripartite tricarboxylate transporter substrate-binding protein, partial [Polyangiaceae bacterium]
TDLLHVPYRGGGAVVQSMMAGQADSSFMTTPTVQQFIKSCAARSTSLARQRRCFKKCTAFAAA